MKNNKILKKCAKCSKEFYTKHKTKAYCKECYSTYQLTYREKHKGNYIYIFKNADETILNIGSTISINERISKHKNGFTQVSKVLKNDEFNIYYVDIKDKLTREELYFIEYYLIHKHFLMYGAVPKGNQIETYNVKIDDNRQIELIYIAEHLNFKQYNKKCFYKLLPHSL